MTNKNNKITKFFKKIINYTFGAIIARVILGVLIGVFWFFWSSNNSETNFSSDIREMIFLGAFIIFFLIRIWFAIKVRKSVGEKKYVKIDIPHYLFAVGFLIPIVWLVTDTLNFANYQSNNISLVIGTILFIISAWIMYKSHLDLDKQLSATLEIKKEHHLITTGIYKNIRHPMYLGFLLYTIGQALVIPNFIAGLSGLIGFILFIALRLKNEEKMLKDRFGSDYISYCKKTKKIIPKIW